MYIQGSGGRGTSVSAVSVVAMVAEIAADVLLLERSRDGGSFWRRRRVLRRTS